ncbi:hypothetical protein P7K49_010331 [Saguinus oedipus]|uniref:Uncharacterized protein n=1 Tax=Saguinus oedipus TaxID=9490 RepID=A0ABQ9VMG6_SAGOE|nr:hypothetical protein P7K49_010331 [Saguinus oedipus]
MSPAFLACSLATPCPGVWVWPPPQAVSRKNLLLYLLLTLPSLTQNQAGTLSPLPSWTGRVFVVSQAEWGVT